jgi:aspartate 1-decarboxylase
METLRKVLRCKIHRATITGANVDYEGSITVPPELLLAAGLAEYEAVNIWNVTSGTRFETYTILGEPGSSDICVNGAAAHLVTPGDIIIIAAFQMIPESRMPGYEPKVVFVDSKNQIKELRPEVAGPKTAPSLSFS